MAAKLKGQRGCFGGKGWWFGEKMCLEQLGMDKAWMPGQGMGRVKREGWQQRELGTACPLLHAQGWKVPVKQSCSDLLQERKGN